MNWKLAINGGFGVGFAAAALLVAACGSYGTSGYGTAYSPSSNGRYPGVTSPPAGTPAPPAAASSTVALSNTSLGQILVDGKGRTLYLFEGDRSAMSNCYGDCASVWPPLLATSVPIAGSGLSQPLLTVSVRKDGSSQVVYNGHPLYYFVSDRQAGDLTGEGISGFGAAWYTVSAAGDRVLKA